MKERTLVHMIFRKDCTGFRTVSRSRKSPHRFFISRDNLEKLGHKPELIVHDVCSFAVLRRDSQARIIEIEITWLSEDRGYVFGYQDTLALPYEKIMEHLRESQQGEPVVWKTFSMVLRRQPQIVFKSRRNLHAVLENAAIRRKLIRFLRDQFRWPYSEQIEFYDDFMPYNFIFKEIQAGEPVMTGGLILHGQEDLKKAYYSIHT